VTAPPDGFAPYRRSSPYLDIIGPVYESATDPSIAGLWIDHRHTNSRGFLHAGLLVAVVDTIMGHTCERALGDGRRLTTVSLTSDFIGPARAGQWLDVTATVRRTGERLSFAACDVTTTDGSVVLCANGVFLTVGRTLASANSSGDPL
jgi:uncharacterized protein (TIGR00369 family)